jgi:NAD dependent epimerase/dehydratase family enzyme
MQKDVRGVYNAVAPNPISNKELIIGLAIKMKRSFYIPLHVPAFIIKLVFGELSIEVLKSVTVSSNKVREAGFTFLFPSIEVALDDLAPK